MAKNENLLQPIGDKEPINPEHYYATRSDGLSYAACIQETVESVELVRQFDRLYGTHLVSRTTPIERMIDKATGKLDDDIQAFLRFVWNYIFIRTPDLTKP